MGRYDELIASLRAAAQPDRPVPPEFASYVGKIRAGASLIQIYSGLVFRGLGLVDEIKRIFVAALERDGAQKLADYVGADEAAATAEPWPADFVRR